jgi:hypothetical protein
MRSTITDPAPAHAAAGCSSVFTIPSLFAWTVA